MYWSINMKISIGRLIRWLCLAGWLFVLANPLAASVHKIGPGLYAYISENDSSANSTFLVTNDGIFVVDTGLNAQEGAKLLAEIRKVSSAPVRWIVNTHYHQDHRGGNSTVGPNALIISTGYTRDRVLQSDAHAYKLNMVVNQQVVMHIGDHEIRIFYPGPAHTMGDLMVYFPDEQTIATGDLFLTNSCPAMDEGDMENWIQALNRILTFSIAHVVPGHFELATPKELRRFRDYLAALRDQVAPMYRDGATLQQVKQRVSLPQFSDFRQFPKYEATLADNAEAYYKQLERRAQH